MVYDRAFSLAESFVLTFALTAEDNSGVLVYRSLFSSLMAGQRYCIACKRIRANRGNEGLVGERTYRTIFGSIRSLSYSTLVAVSANSVYKPYSTAVGVTAASMIEPESSPAQPQRTHRTFAHPVRKLPLPDSGGVHRGVPRVPLYVPSAQDKRNI